MQYVVDSDEFYPVYFFKDEDTGYTEGVIELSAEERADFERVWSEWDVWQKRIGLAVRP